MIRDGQKNGGPLDVEELGCREGGSHQSSFAKGYYIPALVNLRIWLGSAYHYYVKLAREIAWSSNRLQAIIYVDPSNSRYCKGLWTL